MNSLKTFILISIVAIGATVSAQNETVIRQELSIVPEVVFGGVKKTSSGEKLHEQNSGFGYGYEYGVLFNNFGLSLNFFYHVSSGDEESIGEFYQFTNVTAGEYASFCFLLGPQINYPVTNNDFKSYVNLRFETGVIYALLPPQTFTTGDGEDLKYPDAKNAGMGMQVSIGYKADLTSRFSAGLNFQRLSEMASMVRNSYGSIETSQNYDWDFSYNKLALSLIYRF